MAKRKAKKHKAVQRRVRTAEGWRRSVEKETGKRVHTLPGQAKLEQ